MFTHLIKNKLGNDLIPYKSDNRLFLVASIFAKYLGGLSCARVAAALAYSGASSSQWPLKKAKIETD